MLAATIGEGVTGREWRACDALGVLFSLFSLHGHRGAFCRGNYETESFGKTKECERGCVRVWVGGWAGGRADPRKVILTCGYGGRRVAGCAVRTCERNSRATKVFRGPWRRFKQRSRRRRRHCWVVCIYIYTFLHRTG